MGKVNAIFFVKTKRKYMIHVQIYVDDIIFGVINISLCENFQNV